MMKTIFALSVLLTGGISTASAADVPELVLGIGPGIYLGKGTLKSSDVLVPNLSFVSKRTLNNGVIEAHTTASLLGIEVASATARLEVRARDASSFDLWDLEESRLAGSGSCHENRCSFVATVMNGNLTLRETWVPTGGGFEVLNASQNFGGIEASYEAAFTLVEEL